MESYYSVQGVERMKCRVFEEDDAFVVLVDDQLECEQFRHDLIYNGIYSEIATDIKCPGWHVRIYKRDVEKVYIDNSEGFPILTISRFNTEINGNETLVF